MPFETLANLTFGVHGVFVILVIPSTFLLLTGFYRSRPTLALMHYLSFAVMVAGQIRFGECPLVTLERAFRERGGAEMWYEAGFVRFVTHELTGVMVPPGSVGMLTTTIALATLAAGVRQLAMALTKDDRDSLTAG